MIDGDDKKDKKVAGMGELTDKEGGGVDMCARPYLVPILDLLQNNRGFLREYWNERNASLMASANSLLASKLVQTTEIRASTQILFLGIIR